METTPSNSKRTTWWSRGRVGYLMADQTFWITLTTKQLPRTRKRVRNLQTRIQVLRPHNRPTLLYHHHILTLLHQQQIKRWSSSLMRQALGQKQKNFLQSFRSKRPDFSGIQWEGNRVSLTQKDNVNRREFLYENEMTLKLKQTLTRL